jgi:hypothetical protein
MLCISSELNGFGERVHLSHLVGKALRWELEPENRINFVSQRADRDEKEFARQLLHAPLTRSTIHIWGIALAGQLSRNQMPPRPYFLLNNVIVP